MKEFIEKAFGIKDSELGGWEYNIPEGMEATIVDNKIIVKKKESEEESIIHWIREELEGRYVTDNKVNNVMADKALAWLEKQGKNNMGISETTKKELEDNLNKALAKETSESWNEFLDNQGEQKPINVTDEELVRAKKDAYNDALDKIEYHSGDPSFDDGWSAAIWYLKKREILKS